MFKVQMSMCNRTYTFFTIKL